QVGNMEKVQSWKWRGLVLSLLLSLIITLPPLVEGLLTPPGWVWTGYHGGLLDYPTYLAKMQEGYLGHWVYYDRLTSEYTAPVLIYSFYLFLGHLARWSGLSLPTVFHFSRIFLVWGAFYLFWLWLYLTRKGLEEFFVGIFYSGTALLGFLFGMKVRIQEYFWATALTFPHYSLDGIGIFGILIGTHLWVGERKREGWYYGILGVVGLLLSHPFVLAVVFGTVLLNALIFERTVVKRTLEYLVVLGLLASPWVLYQWNLFSSVEWLKMWREQSPFPPPTLGRLFIEQGFVIISILVFGRRMIKDPTLRLLGVWWLWAWILAYSNLLLNSGEFAFLINVPAGLLTMAGLEGLLPRVKQRKFWLSLALSLTTWGVVAGLWLNAFQVSSVIDEKYLAPQYVVGIEFLRSHGQKGDVVLSGVAPGSFIPYLTGLKPYLGHPCETLEYARKKKEVQEFFSGQMREWDAMELLDKNHIRWIITDEQKWTMEAAVFTGAVKDLPYQSLRKVLDNGVVRVWEYTGKQPK
ncbi:MAG: hypothetical protein QXI12_09075, partial [Candidatus Methanomethyliaceae archaeon]